MIDLVLQEIKWNELRLNEPATSDTYRLLVQGRLEALNWVLSRLPEEG